MENKIKLLMETAGCNHYEAELAYKSAKGNFAEALDFLNKVSPGLGVVKGRLILPDKFIYGAFLIIFDIKQANILTTSAVISENPKIYELDFSLSWEDIDKAIYSYKLEESVLPNFSNIMQEKIPRIIERVFFFESEQSCEDKMKEFLNEVFDTENIVVSIDYSEEPYKTQISIDPPSAHERCEASGKIMLEVEPLVDDDGVPAPALSENDVVWLKITDRREIAGYLAEMLGGKSDEGILPLACQISKARRRDKKVLFEFKFNDSVAGFATVDKKERIKVASRSDAGKISRLWRMIFNN